MGFGSIARDIWSPPCFADLWSSCGADSVGIPAGYGPATSCDMSDSRVVLHGQSCMGVPILVVVPEPGDYLATPNTPEGDHG